MPARVNLLTHILRSMETSWRKAGMLQTERSPSSHHLSPLFTLLLYLFAGTKKGPLNKDTKQNRSAAEDRNQRCIIRVFSKVHSSDRKTTASFLLCQYPQSVSMDVSVKWDTTWDPAFISCLFLNLVLFTLNRVHLGQRVHVHACAVAVQWFDFNRFSAR